MKVAVVTGANRGLGKATSQALANLGYKVVMVGRDRRKVEESQASFGEEKAATYAVEADVTDNESIEGLASTIATEFGRVDVLVNNAGVFLESRDPADSSILVVDPALVLRTFEVNALGPLRLLQAFVPLMRKHGYGRVVNVSSGLGQLSDMGGLYPGYRSSKAALNTFTRTLAAELGAENIKVNSVCPGWVRTDMGGPQASRDLEQGIAGIVWAATLPNDGPTGGFFRDGQPIAW